MKKSIFTLVSLTALSAVAQTERPNIMIIVVDDMGYSDPGCFGGEINTPNIDALAGNGIRLTQFYNSSRSCPSRASLMTGLYAQQAGITAMGQSLNNQCVTIPEVLKQNGYNTGMTGKWHLSLTQAQDTYEKQMKWLAHQADYGPFAPLSSYPSNRGFDEHYGTIWGVVDYFDPFSLVHNETPIDTVPKDFFMTNFVTDKTIHLIDTFSKKQEPYFMYVAYTAPHWPLQALPEDIARYKGKYNDGWDALKTKRYNKMVEMGLIHPSQVPMSKNESNRSWSSETRKDYEAACMEVHAAMVDEVDQGIGKIIQKLKETGDFDNTIIFFMSDNGASPERYGSPGFDRPSMTRDGRVIQYPGSFPTPGLQTSSTGIGDAWAAAVNTPFRYWKSESFHGGNATPMIVHWPEGLKQAKGSIVHKAAHITDIMPTCLELAGAKYPTTFKNYQITPLTSQSILPVIQADSTFEHDVIYWEHEGGRAVRKGHWKLVSLKNANWQLFNLSVDLSETNNVAAENPDIVKELKELWNAWARKNGINVPVEIADTPLELNFYFPFDGNLNDKSEKSFVGTSPNGHSYAQGKFDQALQLNGLGQYIETNTANSVNPQTTQYSVCAWLLNQSTKVPATGTLYEEIVLAQKDGASDAAGRISLYTRLDGGTPFFNNFLGANPNLSRPGSFVRNQWQHVAVVCNPATREITYYVDGVKDTTCYAKAAFESTTGAFRIGGHKANKDYWTGMIDELYMFKGLLSSNDVRKIMENTYFTTSNGKSLLHERMKIKYDKVSGKIFVENESLIKNISLFNLQGAQIISENNVNDISTRGIIPGTYVVRIIDQNDLAISKHIVLN